MNDDEREQFTRQVWEVLFDVAGRQEEHQASQDPATRFVELITAALSTGAAHIACDEDGGRPKTGLMAFGWRGDVAQGKRIGWTDGINVYLEPDTAYAVANELGGKTGAGITVTPTYAERYALFRRYAVQLSALYPEREKAPADPALLIFYAGLL
jgi:hypothetical protein